MAGEAINLGSADGLTWNDYFCRYARALGALPVRHVSPARMAWELMLYGPLLKLAERFPVRARGTALQPAIRPWLATLCRHRIRMSVSKAERILEMRWRTLDAGLAECAEWFLSGGRTP